MLSPFPLMRTCVELSRYRILRAMGIGSWLGGQDVAAGHKFATEIGPVGEGSCVVAGSRRSCLVWPTGVFRPRPVLRAWTGMLPDGSARARRDLGGCFAS